MTQKQLNQLKKGLPRNWRILVQREFQNNGKHIELQSLTNFFNNKFSDPARIEEIIRHIKTVKEAYKNIQSKINSLIEV